MKTQLLEDIGESTELPATPSVANARPMAKANGHGPVGAVGGEPVKPVKPLKPLKPRSAPGVWRTRPDLTLPVATVHEQEDAQAQEPPAPAALEDVFEEIAALEAQLAQPKQHATPEEAPVAPDAHLAQTKLQAKPEEELVAPDAPDLQVAAVLATPAPLSLVEEDRTIPNSIEQTAAPSGPMFYFAEPEPAPANAEASVPAPAAIPPARRGGKYVLGTACLLSVALLAMGAMGARSMYQGRGDATSSASVGAQTKASAPAVVRAAADKSAALQAATLPDVPAPGEPYVFEDRRAPDLPPLVMLEPEPPAPVVAAVPAPSALVEKAQPVAAKPAPARTVLNENIASKLAASKPIATKPVPSRPIVAKTTAAKPVAARPTVVKPIAARPTAARPIAALPIAARPIVVKPVTARQTAPKPIVPRTLASRPSAARQAAAKPAASNEFVRKAAQAVLAPIPAASIRKERAPSRPVSRSVPDLPEPAPLRPFAQVVPAPRPAEQDTSMEATLRACREHGYHEMQCIRRECGMTAYGFACRGR